MTVIRQILRLLAFTLVTLVVAPLQAVSNFLPLKDRYRAARLWHRLSCRAIGVRIHQRGVPAPGKILFLSNHICHIDIPAIGGLTPARFISKKEVRDWPVFGVLATLQDTLFIDRTASRSAMQATRTAIQGALDEGGRLVIFPEGTNTLGDTVLPFKRGVLEGLQAPDYALQPVAIRCEAVDGHSVSSKADFEVYGWGDVSFALHLWRVMGARSVDVSVTFLDTMPVGPDGITGEQIEAAGQAVRALVEAPR